MDAHLIGKRYVPRLPNEVLELFLNGRRKNGRIKNDVPLISINSIVNTAKCSFVTWYYFLFVMGSSNHFYSGVLISGTQVPIFRGSVFWISNLEFYGNAMASPTWYLVGN